MLNFRIHPGTGKGGLCRTPSRQPWSTRSILFSSWTLSTDRFGTQGGLSSPSEQENRLWVRTWTGTLSVVFAILSPQEGKKKRADGHRGWGWWPRPRRKWVPLSQYQLKVPKELLIPLESTHHKRRAPIPCESHLPRCGQLCCHIRLSPRSHRFTQLSLSNHQETTAVKNTAPPCPQPCPVPGTGGEPIPSG